MFAPKTSPLRDRPSRVPGGLIALSAPHLQFVPDPYYYSTVLYQASGLVRECDSKARAVATHMNLQRLHVVFLPVFGGRHYRISACALQLGRYRELR